MPKWMFETRTHRWHEAGLGEQINDEQPGRTWPRLLLFALLIAGVLFAFKHRQEIAPGYGTEARILTAILLFILGWGFAPFQGGALQYINSVGPARFVARAHELAARHGPRFEPASNIVVLAGHGA
mgnify:CR=1 FL=1